MMAQKIAPSKLRNRESSNVATSDISRQRAKVKNIQEIARVNAFNTRQTAIEAEYMPKVKKYEKERDEYINVLNTFSGDINKESSEYEQSYNELLQIGQQYGNENPELLKINSEVTAEKQNIEKARQDMNTELYAQVDKLSVEDRYYSGDPSVILFERSGGFRFFLEDTGKRVSGQTEKLYQYPSESAGFGYDVPAFNLNNESIFKVQKVEYGGGLREGEEVVGIPSVDYNYPSNSYNITAKKLKGNELEVTTPLFVNKGAMLVPYSMGTKTATIKNKSENVLSRQQYSGDVFAWQPRQQKLPLAEKEYYRKERVQFGISFNKQKQTFIKEQTQIPKSQAKQVFTNMLVNNRNGVQDKYIPVLNVQNMNIKKIKSTTESGESYGLFNRSLGLSNPIARGSFVGKVAVRKTPVPVFNNPFMYGQKISGKKTSSKKNEFSWF